MRYVHFIQSPSQVHERMRHRDTDTPPPAPQQASLLMLILEIGNSFTLITSVPGDVMRST